MADSEAVSGLERCFQSPPAEGSSVNCGLKIMMKGKNTGREFGSVAATLEKTKPKMSAKERVQKSPEV